MDPDVRKVLVEDHAALKGTGSLSGSMLIDGRVYVIFFFLTFAVAHFKTEIMVLKKKQNDALHVKPTRGPTPSPPTTPGGESA